jgi:hypothetical protein
MRKPILIIFALLTLSNISFAQDFPFGSITQEELNMKKYNKDTSAHAVVLMEHGRAEIQATNADDIKLIYEYHVKIKIFDKTAFDRGKIELTLYNGDSENFEVIDGISGVTTFTNDNGGMEKVELENSKIYTSKDDKHHSTIKFDARLTRWLHYRI